MMTRVISRETIKPSSPTPSHLYTYNLSESDLLNPTLYMPVVLFFPNKKGDVVITAEEKAIMLKKSLSQSLTQYYPFAGRFPASASSYVNCNDEGVVLLEARNDSQLDTFQRMNSQDETLDQLFADDLVFFKNTGSTNLVAVQLTHFACGGLALAISLSHSIADICTLSSFISYWASVARYGSTDHKEVLPLNPHFIQSSRTHPTQPEFSTPQNKELLKKFASRKFVFSNAKLTDLKNKVAESINNPTRVEVLTSLLYKTAVAATTKKSGCFKPSYLFFMVNVRDKFVHKLPQSTVGNFVKVTMVKTTHASETLLSMVTEEMRKKKSQVEGIENVQQLVEYTKALQGKVGNEDMENVAKGSYWCSSLCGFPFNKLDFGWGMPMGITHLLRTNDNRFMLADTADGDGIEVIMFLERECMDIFENDKEMLSYCHI